MEYMLAFWRWYNPTKKRIQLFHKREHSEIEIDVESTDQSITIELNEEQTTLIYTKVLIDSPIEECNASHFETLILEEITIST